MAPTSAAFVVTIDGPAGAGKSTAAKKLAATLGYAFLDTGAIYRAVALFARRSGVDWSEGPSVGQLADGLDMKFVPDADVNRVILGVVDVTADIRTPEISEGASRVSAHPEVRHALLGLQRRLGETGRIVAEGRDVGTAVFPDAGAKFFLTAPAEVRAQRRAKELQEAGRPAALATVLQDILIRDERDSTRAASPLRKADDAVEIDSGTLTADQVVACMVDLVRSRGG